MSKDEMLQVLREEKEIVVLNGKDTLYLFATPFAASDYNGVIIKTIPFIAFQ